MIIGAFFYATSLFFVEVARLICALSGCLFSFLLSCSLRASSSSGPGKLLTRAINEQPEVRGAMMVR